MRNILVHMPVLGRCDAEGKLTHVRVRGHAFGVMQVHVTVAGPGGTQVVDAIPDGRAQWLAVLSSETGGVPETWSIGTVVRVAAADIEDLNECYAKAETRIRAE